MRLNVLQELKQPLGAVNEFEVSEETARAEGLELQALTGTLRLLRTDRGLLARLRGTGQMQEKCARCAVDITCEVKIDFEEEYVPVIDANTGARIRVSDEDVFRIGPTFELDLSEALRQYILVSEPVKPLCREDCAGLCPQCGADLNRGPCRCAPPSDERWSALARLAGKEREGS